MALFDVSELLLDPDFINNVVLIHRTSQINQFGENIIGERRVPTVASVQPTTGKQILRLPESLRAMDLRTIYIKAEVINDGSKEYPDIIEFMGYRYQIQSSNPWLNFGAGWNECLCTREIPAP